MIKIGNSLYHLGNKLDDQHQSFMDSKQRCNKERPSLGSRAYLQIRQR